MNQRTKKILSITRQAILWIILALVVGVIAVILLFPADRVAKKLVIDTAARQGIELTIGEFDYRFPNRMICRDLTVAPRSPNPVLGESHWRIVDCTVAIKPLTQNKLDVSKLEGILVPNDTKEGEYHITAAFAVERGTTGQNINIGSLAVQGADVNLDLRGNVTSTGSISSTGYDLSINVRQLDRIISSDKSLSAMFMALRLAMAKGDITPPAAFTVRGKGVDISVDRTPSD